MYMILANEQTDRKCSIKGRNDDYEYFLLFEFIQCLSCIRNITFSIFLLEFLLQVNTNILDKSILINEKVNKKQNFTLLIGKLIAVD